MSEQEVRDGLATLVLDEPPLNFDPDALMAKADAAARRRRTLVGAGGATVVIAAAAVVLPITLRGGGGSTSAPVTPGAVITTTANKVPDFAWPPAHNVVPNYSVQDLEQAAHKLQNEAKRVLPTVLTDADDVRADLFAGEAEGDYNAGQLYLNGAVHYTTKLGKAAVDIQVSAGASVSSPAKVCADAGNSGCRIEPQKDGSAIVVTRWHQDKTQAVTVAHYRLDGVVVSVSGFNNDSFVRTPTPYLTRIPISEKQLTSLATDKALTM